MERIIESFIDGVIQALRGEGERRLKLEALSACLEAIRGIRRLFITIYLFSFACFLAALSFFSAGFLFFGELHSPAHGLDDPRFLFSCAVFVLSSLLLAITVRERSWDAAFGLSERIRGLQSAPRTNPTAAAATEITQELLARMIDEAVERRTKKENTQSSVDSVADGE